MIYGISAFAGFEAAAALGEEAKDTRRSVPASIIGIVIVTGAFYLLVTLAEAFGVGPGGIPGLIAQPSPLGYLTSRYWSPSASWAIDLVVVITGLGFVTAANQAAIRVVYAMARDHALPGSLTPLSRRRTPVVAIGCLAVLTLLIGLPLNYAYGGARAFGYLAGAGGPPWRSLTSPGTSRSSARSAPSSAMNSTSGGICSSRPQPRCSSCSPSGGSCTRLPTPL